MTSGTSDDAKDFLRVFPTDYDDLMMDGMDQRTLLCYSLTCLNLYYRVERYLTARYSIKCLLGKFLEEQEWDKFRRLQLETGLAISGSAALHFISRSTTWRPQDMDVYVEHDHARPVIEWLGSAGFQYRPLEILPDLHTVELALAYRKPIYRTGGYDTAASILTFYRKDSVIQVITSYGSIMECIHRFHSTAVMNVITYNKAYCLYPQATLCDRLTLLRSNMSLNRTRVAAIKYHIRGWHVAYSLPAHPETDSFFDLEDDAQDEVISTIENLIIRYTINGGPKRHKAGITFPLDASDIFPEGIRRVGDAQCWSYTLPCANFDLPNISLIETNTWTFGYDFTRGMDIKSHNLKTQGLEFGYSIANKQLLTKIRNECPGTVWKKNGPKRDAEVQRIVKDALKSLISGEDVC